MTIWQTLLQSNFWCISLEITCKFPEIPTRNWGKWHVLHCQTKKGDPSQGAVACINHMCKTCCAQAVDDARLNNQLHDPCKYHKIDLVRNYLPFCGQAQAAVLPSAQVPAQPDQAPLSGSNLSTTVIGPSLSPHLSNPVPQSITMSAGISNSDARPPPTDSVSSPSSQLSPTFVNQLSALAGSQRHTRSLAQPVGLNWIAQKTVAVQEWGTTGDLKIKRALIDDELKHTVKFIIYYEVCSFLHAFMLISAVRQMLIHLFTLVQLVLFRKYG